MAIVVFAVGSAGVFLHLIAIFTYCRPVPICVWEFNDRQTRENDTLRVLSLSPSTIRAPIYRLSFQLLRPKIHQTFYDSGWPGNNKTCLQKSIGVDFQWNVEKTYCQMHRTWFDNANVSFSASISEWDTSKMLKWSKIAGRLSQLHPHYGATVGRSVADLWNERLRSKMPHLSIHSG